MPTPYEVIEVVFQKLVKDYQIHAGMKLVDMGSGDGRVIVTGAADFHLDCTGIEINLELIESTNMLIKKRAVEQRCRVVERDFYDIELEEYEIVWIFLFSSSHRYFRHQLEKLKPGTILVAIRYSFDEFEELWASREEMNTGGFFSVYIYRKK